MNRAFKKAYILNEWIWHALEGTYDKVGPEIGGKAIMGILQNCDIILIPDLKKYTKKIYKSLTKLKGDHYKIVNIIFQYLHNSEKIVFISTNEFVKLRDVLNKEIVENVPNDDVYLVETFFTAKQILQNKADVVFVTSDNRLIDKLPDEMRNKTMNVEDFMNVIDKS